MNGPRLWFVVVLIAACAPRTPPPRAPSPEPAAAPAPAPTHAVADTTDDTSTPKTEPVDWGAEGWLAEIESNLMDFDFAVRFEIESQGTVKSRLFGELRAQRDHVTLSARGSFSGKPVELSLKADGRELKGASGPAKLSFPQPPALKESLVIGLTRMGILHNLAALVSARPPDHADGGVRQWVLANDVVSGVKIGPDEPGEQARNDDPRAMSFGIIVADQRAGDATLWVDLAARLPLERHQVVHLAGGDMRVHETYEVTLLHRD